MTVVIEPEELNALGPCGTMPHPGGVLLCTPDEFDVVDVKNPFMEGQVGGVDRTLASAQWHSVRAAFLAAGLEVWTIDPHPGLEDMVFCANQTFVGLGAAGERLFVVGQMKHASRQREVPHFVRYLEERGYRGVQLNNVSSFEGSGDLLWHPTLRCIWAGHGHRTSMDSFEQVSQIFDAPVLALELISERFYHLDTCLCLVDKDTALVHRGGFSTTGNALIASRFKNVIDVDEHEAATAMACNATACQGRTVIIQQGAPRTVAALRAASFEVVEVDTSEFMKSGGSVFCLKQFIF